VNVSGLLIARLETNFKCRLPLIRGTAHRTIGLGTFLSGSTSRKLSWRQLLLLRRSLLIASADLIVRLLNAVDGPALLWLGPRCIPVLFQNARFFRRRRRGRRLSRRLRGWCRTRRRGTRLALVINISAMRRTAGAGRAANFTAAVRTISRTAAAMAKNGTPRTAIGRWAVAIAVNTRKDALEGPQAAVTVRACEIAIARVARIAAIRRIADPLVDVDVTATFAANAVASQCRP